MTTSYVDCPIGSQDIAQAVMETSAKVYLVSAPEIGSIRDLSRHVDRLSLLDTVTDKLQVVLNRSVAQFAINSEQIERAIKVPIAIKLPNKYAEMTKAQNLGEPVAPGGTNDISVQIRKWAAMILGVSAPAMQEQQKKKSLFSWFTADVAC